MSLQMCLHKNTTFSSQYYSSSEFIRIEAMHVFSQKEHYEQAKLKVTFGSKGFLIPIV